jgi:NAD(P)-dependent dehydrogenase (short-subunit alcohol dehydrogenase family)
LSRSGRRSGRHADAPTNLADQRLLLPLALDVTDRSQIETAVAAAEQRFGRIDVLVNNAGSVLCGGVEEARDGEIRDQFETNFFGFVAMTQAVLPIMRRQCAGRIINLSSMGGISSGMGMGYYGATKFALAAISESLAEEGASFGIKVTIVEPGEHRTEAISHARFTAAPIADYAAVAEHRRRMSTRGGKEAGDPRLAAEALIAVADAAEPPLHLPLGADALGRLNRKLDRLAEERDR